MSQQWDKILLYKDRSVSQCIETTFDFMRQNRRAWFSSALTLLLVVVMIPLSLLPSVSLFERAGVFKAVGKSLRLGFNAWFQLFFTIALMVLFGFFMTMVIELPSSLFDLAFGALYGSGRSLGAVAVLFQYSFTALLYLGFFIVISMTLMAAAYQYGTVSERIDIASLEGDIRNFENL